MAELSNEKEQEEEEQKQQAYIPLRLGKKSVADLAKAFTKQQLPAGEAKENKFLRKWVKGPAAKQAEAPDAPSVGGVAKTRLGSALAARAVAMGPAEPALGAGKPAFE